ncbi:MAG: 3-phosphoshikimate 1-carboxyvinyltransferase [Chitinophagaceae bacterium]|nr:3-phosphoshikimate 1-carboxyvinyltransferase [Chitinophagaceae bacterium]
MRVKIHPSGLMGSIQAPPSKSCTQRACAAALLTDGKTVIDNIGKSNDEMAAVDIIRRLGAEVSVKGNKVAVVSGSNIFRSPDPNKSLVVDPGESGLSMRMFAPIAALFNFDITFNGKGSLVKRPMDFLDTYLPKLGVTVFSNNGKLPVTIHGPMKAKEITVAGGLSSQFLTGMLFAYAKAVTKPTILRVDNLMSRPYIDLTLDVLNKFGFRVSHKDYKRFEILPYQPEHGLVRKYNVEGDWSNAAFLLVAGAIAGPVAVRGMDMDSVQGDKAVMDALYQCGADVKIGRGGIRVTPAPLKSFDFDATHCPDLFPPLVALASYCSGVTTIRGVTRLLHKESNRALALREEFGRMNVKIDLDGDVMKIHGSDQVKGAKVDSHNDHRMAMACAVAATKAKGVTTISGAEAVNKSYPSFFDDMKKLKMQVTVYPR